MTNKRPRLLKIVLACAVSGIVAGVLSASQCPRAESDCAIAAVQSHASDTTSLTLWLHWVNWLPGALFGALFSLAALEADAVSRARRVLLYSLVSTAAYVIAGLVFSAFLAVADGDEFSLIIWIWPAGLAAGLLGALLLGMGANRLLRPSTATVNTVHGGWLPALVGAVAGLLFVGVCLYGEQQIFLAFPAAFVIWQVAVGLAAAPPEAAQSERTGMSA